MVHRSLVYYYIYNKDMLHVFIIIYINISLILELISMFKHMATCSGL